MAGIDWQTAKIDKREVFSFTSGQVSRLCGQITQIEGVDGCVLLSTCNRTELYLSGGDSLQPVTILCQAAGVEEAEALFCEHRGEQAARHLMEVSCGLCSQILGEDQIVSQVKRAYQLAHEAGSADAGLSQMFRLAATAGKRSRTQVRLSAAPLSVAGQVVEQLETRLGDLTGKRALVIGNGEMGRLACSLLAAKGCQVTVTLRTYRHGETIVPAGCQTIGYDERTKLLPVCDILLSATTSPHYTITCDHLAGLACVPQAVCDLSIPRDIEPNIRELPGVQLFLDMDSMGGREAHVDVKSRQQVDEIIEQEMQKLTRWFNYREDLPIMDDLCQLIAERVATGYDFCELTDGEETEVTDKMEQAARLAVEKTTRLLLNGLQGNLADGALENCREAILRKAPQLRDRRT